MVYKTILFYGDSNTYGYDPTDFYRRRFPYKKRWTAMIAKHLGDSCSIISEGMNGRCIPDMRYEQRYIRELCESVGEDGLLCTMLGTNDILRTSTPDAMDAVNRMDSYLDYLLTHLKPEQILIIAPPYIGKWEIMDPLFRRFREESMKMNAAFETLAFKKGVSFANAADWGIDLCFDEVHFTEEGHKTFAEKMISDVFPRIL